MLDGAERGKTKLRKPRNPKLRKPDPVKYVYKYNTNINIFRVKPQWNVY